MDAEIKIQDGKSDMIKVFKTKYRLMKIINKGYFCQFRQNLDRGSASFILPKYDEKRSTSFMNKLYAMATKLWPGVRARLVVYKINVPKEAQMSQKKSLFNKFSTIFIIFFTLPIIISCGESKEMIRQRQENELREKQRQEALQKRRAEIDAVINDLKTQYQDPFDLSDEKNCELFARAYNNPEENPKIRNSTDTSENEFQYQKDKIQYSQLRNKKYAIMSFNIFGNELQKYDFQKKSFSLQFKSYTIMAPEGNVIYTKKRPPVVKLLVKGVPDIDIKIEPDLAENFKSGITNTATGFGAMYGLESQYKDRAILYVIFKINGKILDDDIQHISVDIADYVCFWYIDAGSSISQGGRYGNSQCSDIIECSSDIKIFRK